MQVDFRFGVPGSILYKYHNTGLVARLDDTGTHSSLAISTPVSSITNIPVLLVPNEITDSNPFDVIAADRLSMTDDVLSLFCNNSAAERGIRLA
jgi:hypothetical protein